MIQDLLNVEGDMVTFQSDGKGGRHETKALLNDQDALWVEFRHQHIAKVCRLLPLIRVFSCCGCGCGCVHGHALVSPPAHHTLLEADPPIHPHSHTQYTNQHADNNVDTLTTPTT